MSGICCSLKIISPKIILMPQRHILGWLILLPHMAIQKLWTVQILTHLSLPLTASPQISSHFPVSLILQFISSISFTVHPDLMASKAGNNVDALRDRLIGGGVKGHEVVDVF